MILAIAAHPRLERLEDLIAIELQHAHVELASAGLAFHAFTQRGRGEQWNEVEREIPGYSNVIVSCIETAVRTEKDTRSHRVLFGFGSPDNHCEAGAELSAEPDVGQS